MKLKLYLVLSFAASYILVSCGKSNNYTQYSQIIIKEFKVTVTSSNENHIVASPYTVGTMTIQIFDDKTSINYDVDMFKDSGNNRPDDRVTNVELRLGDPSTDNGTLLAILPGRYRAGTATGFISGLRKSLIDTILNNSIAKYVNIFTTYEPLGRVRGQVNADIVLSNNVFLSGQNVKPTSVPTTTSGLGFIRVTSDMMLYSKFIINNDDLADPVQGATVHVGNVSNTGPLILTLANSPTALANPKISILTVNDYENIVNAPSYVSIYSVAYPNGKVRGQLRY